jgi:L-threonylcarbamoyladenylate synthase
MAKADKPLIAIVVATTEDAEQMRPAGETLDELGAPHEIKLGSGWAGSRELFEWAALAEVRGVRVLIAAAGAEPALPGLLAAACRLPVIAVPTAGDGAEAGVWPVLELNPGATAPVAVVSPGGARQAAALALRIVAATDPRWRAALDELSRETAEEMEAANVSLKANWHRAPTIQAVDDDDAGDDGMDSADGDADGEDVPVYDLTAQDRARTGRRTRAGEEDAQSARVRAAEELNRQLDLEASGGRRTAEADDVDGEESGNGWPSQSTGAPARRLGRMKIDPELLDVPLIEEVVDCLLEGGIVALPTETVYGLAVDATNPGAVERLFAVKGRDLGKSISLMVDSSKLLAAIAQNVTVEVRRLMEAFWPGPLTLVFQKRPINFRHVSAGETIGVRLPNHPIPLAIMQALARPLACTSANLSGRPDARDADEIERVFGDRIDALIDAGPLAAQPPSTVLDVTGDPYRILRMGSISREQIAALVGQKLADKE